MYRTDKTSNAIFSMVYHFIVVVKFRKKVFTRDDIISDLKMLIEKISDTYGVEVVEQECGIDHLHILFRAKPTTELIKYINAIKGQSARALRKAYREHLSDKLWGDGFWSPSYFLATTGNVTIDVLKEYVENQRKQPTFERNHEI